MKTRLFALLAALLLLPALFGLSGCQTAQGRFDPNTLIYDTNAPADTVVVTAQQTRSQVLDTLHMLWTTEKQFRKELWKVSPEIKHYADYTRKNAKVWLDNLTENVRTYQLNRTPDNRLKLEGALALLRNMRDQAQIYLDRATTEKIRLTKPK